MRGWLALGLIGLILVLSLALANPVTWAGIVLLVLGYVVRDSSAATTEATLHTVIDELSAFIDGAFEMVGTKPDA